MAVGKKKSRQGGMWIATSDLARSPGHPFYERLNRLLEKHGFDVFAEDQCRSFYAERLGRPSLPPGTYFRLLLIGYFEGLGSERGIAWRVADSLALREFLGLSVSDATPDHSTLSRNRRLIAVETHQEIFAWVLAVLAQENLLKAQTLGVDATTLEADAAMKSIVRRDTGEGYAEFLQRLASESGEATPTRAELSRKDRKRKGKGSNDDWTSPSDPDARITRMKDGRTHLAHKAEHAVDLETGAIVAVTVQPADRGDTQSLEETLSEVLENLGAIAERTALPEGVLTELVADRGYNSAAVLVEVEKLGLRSYIAEPKRPRRRWKGRVAEQAATYANHRRMKGSRGKKLSKQRTELVERSMAHNYETGGLRRVHLRGQENVLKRVLIHVAGFNLGLVMRKTFGRGTPRGLQGRLRRLLEALLTALSLRDPSHQSLHGSVVARLLQRVGSRLASWIPALGMTKLAFTTGC
jgi:transposase